MPQISFKASFVNTANIQQLQHDGYKPFNAAFVEMHPNSKNDISTLKCISNTWGQESYASSIYNAALGDSRLDDLVIEKPIARKFYALTSQKDSFEKLNPENVLGMVHVNNYPNFNSIEFLQTNPEYIIPVKKESFMEKCLNKIFKIQKPIYKQPKYKHIGSGILDSLKKLYSDKPMTLLSVHEAKKFYKKNGFVREIFFNPYGLIWKNK